MKEYRTQKQYQEISDSLFNGNWTQGARECIEFGFWANDLIREYEQAEFNIIGLDDIALVAEMAQKIRSEGVK